MQKGGEGEWDQKRKEEGMDEGVERNVQSRNGWREIA